MDDISRSPLADDIFRYISTAFPRGTIFFLEDLPDFPGRTADCVRMTMSDLVRDSYSIIRIARGVYCYPRLDASAKVMVPDDQAVAAALARRWRVRIAPCGAQAAYLAGLTPVSGYPLRFVSDGSEQHFDLQNGRRIEFVRRKSVKVFDFLDEGFRNLVEGLRWLGRDGVKEWECAVAREALKAVPASSFSHDVLLAPGWIRDLLLKLRADAVL